MLTFLPTTLTLDHTLMAAGVVIKASEEIEVVTTSALIVGHSLLISLDQDMLSRAVNRGFSFTRSLADVSHIMRRKTKVIGGFPRS